MKIITNSSDNKIAKLRRQIVNTNNITIRHFIQFDGSDSLIQQAKTTYNCKI